jgi:hypothetical protein
VHNQRESILRAIEKFIFCAPTMSGVFLRDYRLLVRYPQKIARKTARLIRKCDRRERFLCNWYACVPCKRLIFFRTANAHPRTATHQIVTVLFLFNSGAVFRRLP